MKSCDDRKAVPTVTVRAKPGEPDRAMVSVGNWTFRAALGRSGISIFKREGDGATPLAAIRMMEGFYRADRIARPITRLPMRAMHPRWGWCDAPRHASYNKRVCLPFPDSHEVLSRDDALYDIVLVLDWNVTERRRGAGSAIFLHLARSGYRPTEGCIAVAQRDMLRLLGLVDAQSVIRVVRC